MSENNAKKKMSFGEAWQKFGTIGIFVLLLVILAVIKPTVYLVRAACRRF